MMSMFDSDTLTTAKHVVISGATGTAIATPDHTAQILAVVIQILTLASLLLGKKK